MIRSIFVTVALFATSAFAGAEGYDLKIELSVNGKHVSSPRIVAKKGELATITQKSKSKERFIEVIANEGEIQGNKGIMLNFVVGVIGKDGVRTIISKPQILARENEKAEMTVGGNPGDEILSLSVIANRKKL